MSGHRRNRVRERGSEASMERVRGRFGTGWASEEELESAELESEDEPSSSGPSGPLLPSSSESLSESD